MSVERARALRRSLTPQEAKLWTRLRELRPLGHHPRRQDPIGGFVADFSFRRRRLIVEVDGGQHGGSADVARDAALERLGYRVLRFWNVDVDRNVEGVIETILAELDSRPLRE
ncbi:endonuclease domain-containing protein [Chenggangzhangella methanolivorans]|uniref:DUF559 domain-containing protein n=1 Tax=Chenggangzhangella methanolivorans TaxID=1437009 RepID=A0A9E6RDU8_9HYPH|nr:DUF559 domain-containing protein [Chenggangzhangella methanolivorans]QZO01543.1 DUF559 domain-containing protein [Chenggangzhangella methanolivorans]